MCLCEYMISNVFPLFIEKYLNTRICNILVFNINVVFSNFLCVSVFE